MRRLSHGGAAALLLLAAGAQAQISVPAEVVTQLDRLRTIWPEVPSAEMRGGQRLEFRDGVIRLGEQTLRDLSGSPANPDGAVLTFLLGHESWHAVQNARHAPAEINRMKDNRTLECEADFMGAAVAYRALAGRGLSAERLTAARHAIQTYVRARASGFGGAAAYPEPGLRATAIGIGWAQARTADLFRGADGERLPPMADAARAADVCARIGQGGDASQGVIRITWDSSLAVDNVSGRATGRLTLVNHSRRQVIVRLLAPSRYVPPSAGGPRGEPEDDEIFSVIDDTVTLAGRASVSRSYPLPAFAAAETGGYSWTEPPSLLEGPAHLAMSRYAVSEAPARYCFENIGQLPLATDRALLVRLASIALAAEDDFRPIMGWEAYDSETGFDRVSIMAALNPTGRDMITISGATSASAYMTVFTHADGALVTAEFDRLRAMFVELCGEASITEVPVPSEPTSDNKAVVIERFAPRANVRLSANIPRPSQTQNGPDYRVGNIGILISRAVQ